MFKEKGVLKICSKFTGEHPWRSVIFILKSQLVMGVHLQICCKFAQHLSLKILLHGCFWYIDLILSLPLLHSSNFITLPLIVTKNANKVKYWHVFHILAIASTLVNLILLWCFIAPTRRNKCWTLNFIFCWLTLKLLNCSRFQDPTYAFQAHEFV